MREGNQNAAVSVPMTVEEYIQFELTAECRHEYNNGQLFEMPGEKRTNNRVAGNIYMLLRNQLEARGYEVFSHDMKVSNHERNKFFYPDVFVTKEPQTKENEYIQYAPELIVEVVSPSSRITDTVDKYIAYSAIPSLKYYLIVEPEVIYATLYEKNGEGKWSATLYSSLNDVVPLPLLDLSLPLSEIYK
jgi:Uma2 family endonuclease